MRKKEHSHEQGGRPRSELSTVAILKATIELLEENGYSALSVEAIATRAGVGKTTIYRWWSNKEYLLLDVFLRVTQSEVQFKEHASIQQNFSQLLISLTNVLSSTVGRTMLSIVAQSGPDSEIANKFYSSYLQPRRHGGKKILESAITKGEIRNNVILDLVLDMLFGPIYFRILVYKDNPSVEYIESLVDQVLEGITT